MQPLRYASRRNPTIQTFYQRLLASGKPPKVALTACMRKLLVVLNAIARTGTRWEETMLDFKDSSNTLFPRRGPGYCQ